MDAGTKSTGKIIDAQHRLGAILDTKKGHAKAVDVNAVLGTATIKSIALVDLFIDRTYQRELDEARAKKIADNMRPEILGEIAVSDRGNGKFAIVDGQHRYHALCLLGYCKPGATVVCRVFVGRSVEEEAMTFAYLGGFGNTRRALNAFSLWKARVAGREPIAMDITAIARKRGLTIDEGKKKHTISAVRTVESIYNAGNLAETLDAAKSWANGDANTSEFYDGEVMRALSSALREYDALTPAMLSKRLGGIRPNRLVVNIKEMVKQTRWSAHLAACVVIRNQYNSGLAKKNRLPLPSGILGADDE